MPRKIYFKVHLNAIAKASFSDAVQTAENGLHDKGTWMSISPENKLVLNIKAGQLNSITRTYSSHPDTFFQRYGLTLEIKNKNHFVTLGSIDIANKTSQKQKRLAALAVIKKLHFLTFSDRLKKILTAPIQALKASPTSDHLVNLTVPQFAYLQSKRQCEIYLLVPNKSSALQHLVKSTMSTDTPTILSANYLKQLQKYQIKRLANENGLGLSTVVKTIPLIDPCRKINVLGEISNWIENLKLSEDNKRKATNEENTRPPKRPKVSPSPLSTLSDVYNHEFDITEAEYNHLDKLFSSDITEEEYSHLDKLFSSDITEEQYSQLDKLFSSEEMCHYQPDDLDRDPNELDLYKDNNASGNSTGFWSPKKTKQPKKFDVEIDRMTSAIKVFPWPPRSIAP